MVKLLFEEKLLKENELDLLSGIEIPLYLKRQF